MKIHINCDMAESFGNFSIGNDQAMMPLVDACSIACGFHGGDPIVIEKTIQLAIQHGVEIGAHPSYPDLQGFGRRAMLLDEKELLSMVKYQIAAVKGLTESAGIKLIHVKAHGALYNKAAVFEKEARCIVLAVKAIDPDLTIYAPFNSILEQVASDNGIKVFREAFADRRYNDDGTLTPRSVPGAIINNPEEALGQVLNLIENKVKTVSGAYIPMLSDTICVHGDHTNTLEILKLIRMHKINRKE
jgi:5-oxoprolinase (ATP-hydrolysing) subunit A